MPRQRVAVSPQVSSFLFSRLCKMEPRWPSRRRRPSRRVCVSVCLASPLRLDCGRIGPHQQTRPYLSFSNASFSHHRASHRKKASFASCSLAVALQKTRSASLLRGLCLRLPSPCQQPLIVLSRPFLSLRKRRWQAPQETCSLLLAFVRFRCPHVFVF